MNRSEFWDRELADSDHAMYLRLTGGDLDQAKRLAFEDAREAHREHMASRQRSQLGRAS